MRTGLLVLLVAAGPAFAQRDQFQAADANRDGYLTKSEWVASGRKVETFAERDGNGDGRLTRAEIAAAREAREAKGGGPRKFFAATDTNGDSVLSRSEWQASGRNPQGFGMMDRNGDGKVTRAEADAAMAAIMGGAPK